MKNHGYFNGWTIVTLPSDPPAPTSIDFTLQDLLASVHNPFTGQQPFQDWQASFIEGSVSMPPLTRAQAPAWIAYLMSTRVSLNVFQMGDPLAATPRGSVSGTPLVNGGTDRLLIGYQRLDGLCRWSAPPRRLAPDWILALPESRRSEC